MSKVNFEDLKKDAITGFISRTFFEVEEREKMRVKFFTEKMFCIFGDFNFLKFANDIYGYGEVDRALNRIANVISDVLSNEMDDYEIIRYGGDEILILGKGFNKRQVMELIKKIQGGISSMAEESNLGISLAMGYSLYREAYSLEESMIIARERMKSDKEDIKSDTYIDVEKVACLLLPTIERMVPKNEYDDFLRALERELKR